MKAFNAPFERGAASGFGRRAMGGGSEQSTASNSDQEQTVSELREELAGNGADGKNPTGHLFPGLVRGLLGAL